MRKGKLNLNQWALLGAVYASYIIVHDDSSTYSKYLAPDKEGINNALDTIADRERFVLEKRFGLNNDTPQTLQQIGIALGITSNRVRQIEDKALRKLRHASRQKLFFNNKY